MCNYLAIKFLKCFNLVYPAWTPAFETLFFYFLSLERCKSWNPFSFSVAQKLESRVKKFNYANPSILKDKFSEIVFIQTFFSCKYCFM